MREWCRPCAGVALLQLRQVEAGAEVVALAVEHGGAHGVGQVLEGVAQREDRGRRDSALRLAGRFRRTMATSPSISSWMSLWVMMAFAEWMRLLL